MGEKKQFTKVIAAFILAFVFMTGWMTAANADVFVTKGTLYVGSNVSTALSNTATQYYKVTPSKTDAYKFTLSSKTGGSTTNMTVTLYDVNAKELTKNGGKGNATLRAYLEKGSTFYIGVKLSGNTASETCSLTMEESDLDLISIKVANVVNARDNNYVSIVTNPISGLTWDADASVLTMNNFTGSYVLKASIDKDVYNTVESVNLTIDVKGVNTLKAFDNAILIGNGINLTITGNGILNIVGNSTDSAIDMKGNLSLEGANIYISGTFTDDLIDCSSFMMSSGSISATVNPDLVTKGRSTKTDFSEYASIIDASKAVLVTGGTIFANYMPMISGTTLGDIGQIFDCDGIISVSNANIVITGDATIIEKVDTYYARATLNIDSSSVNVIKSTKNINIKYLTMSLSQYFYTYNGKAKKPTAYILGLTQGTDYTITYKNNKKVGIATVIAKGKGKYTGTLKTTFTITAKKGSVINDKKYKYKVTKVVGSDGTYGNVMVTGLKKTSLTQIKIAAVVKINGAPYNVTSIKKNAFKNNKKIKKITIGKNVKTIGNYAFSGCKKVKKLVINSTVLTKIGVGAFKNNKKLKTAVIKSTKLKTIGKQAFFGDKKLKTLTIKSTSLKTIGKKALYRKGGVKLTIKVPSAKATAYKKLIKKAKTNKYKVKGI